MTGRKLFFAMVCVLSCLFCMGVAQASVSDGRIVANIDKIETYGTTLHVVGWVYDANNTGAAVTIHVDSQKAYTANKAKGSANSACPVGGSHYFDFAHPWTNDGARVMMDALYTDGSGACNIYDNIAVFPDIYTITYNANGGSGAPAADKKHRDISLRLSGTIPTRAGHTFKGWATSASGSAAYQANGSYTSNSSRTLYAVWEKNSYTLSYDANGGEGAPAAQTAVYGDALTLSDAVPTFEGRDFLGWAESADGKAVYPPEGSLTLTDDRTLYAVWQLKTYPVTYDANGGDGAPANQVKTYGTDLALSGDVPTRQDYVFQGWAERADAAEVVWQPGDVYRANAALSLYAVWKEARLPGDVNGDKAVNDADAQLLLKYLADLPVEIVAPNADVTGDGKIDGRDALRLMKYLTGADVGLE